MISVTRLAKRMWLLLAIIAAVLTFRRVNAG
jgi:hypothetical protein